MKDEPLTLKPEQDETPLILANTGSLVGLFAVLAPGVTCDALGIPATDGSTGIAVSAGAWLLAISYIARNYDWNGEK